MGECTMSPRRTKQATSFFASSSGWDTQWWSSQTLHGCCSPALDAGLGCPGEDGRRRRRCLGAPEGKAVSGISRSILRHESLLRKGLRHAVPRGL